MEDNRTLRLDPQAVDTPCYILDKEYLRENLEILAGIQKVAGAKVLLALKAFSMWSVFDECSNYLSGASASSLNEAKLIKEYFRGEVHFCAPGIVPRDADELIKICDHIVFNSKRQFELYKDKCLQEGVEIGLRINPEHSEVSHEIYDPCSAGSRLGMPLAHLERIDCFEDVSGLHFHNLCELGADALERTLEAVEVRFGDYLHRMKWVNFGGGHHITRPDYDIALLCSLIERIRDKYNVQVYLEPGEAIALNTGFLVASVLDIVERDMPVAVLDTSAAAHMPDVLEMP
ncbi:MAG: carboxynorspermidine decarboxylase, partial [Phycisphaerae bacterium]